MTREEIISLLEIVSAAYPNSMKNIKDAGALVTAWEMVLGEFSAEAVYKSARLHMTTNKFFPSPSDIRDNIVRAQIAYTPTIPNAIEPKASLKYDKELDDFCKWIGFGCDPDDTVELPSGFLPYEQ